MSTTARARAVTVLAPVTSRNPSTPIETVTIASNVPAAHAQSDKRRAVALRVRGRDVGRVHPRGQRQLLRGGERSGIGGGPGVAPRDEHASDVGHPH